MNEYSSRSHAICDVALRWDRTGSLAGKLRIVDLAGSERHDTSVRQLSASEWSDQRLAEMKDINYSLGCLKECIRHRLKRAKGRGAHVPYRNSKLTMLLRENLEVGAAATTTFVCCVSPLRSALPHSRNSLDYAMAMIETTRAQQDRAKFVGPETWTKAQMVDFVASLEKGRFRHLAQSFQISGKMMAVARSGSAPSK